MTRENKLALVVGFGLILLVGILISDHFSVARNQAAAQLTQVVDPLGGSSGRDDVPADLIALRPRARDGRLDWSPAEPRIAAPPAASARRYDGVRPVPEIDVDLPDTIEMGWSDPVPNQADRGTVGLDPRDAARLPYTIHVVSEGESLSSICGDRFGDRSLALELARYNEIADPDRVQIGHRLRIPSADDLVRGRPAPTAAPAAPARVAAAPTTPTASPPASPLTYTVKKGDVLSEIASRLLGSSRKYLVIYEHNKDVLDSPDALEAGMTLKIPRNSS